MRYQTQLLWVLRRFTVDWFWDAQSGFDLAFALTEIRLSIIPPFNPVVRESSANVVVHKESLHSSFRAELGYEHLLTRPLLDSSELDQITIGHNFLNF